MILFAIEETGEGCAFHACDPNNPNQPQRLAFNSNTRSFSLPANRYWGGGELDIIEIYRNWLM
jgi:hypothetical protein